MLIKDLKLKKGEAAKAELGLLNWIVIQALEDLPYSDDGMDYIGKFTIENAQGLPFSIMKYLDAYSWTKYTGPMREP